MIQLSLKDITLSHSSLPLVTHANLNIDAGERVCLIGRNGAGKSTLLKLINGEIEPDEGIVEKSSGLTVAMLSQSIPTNLPGTIEQIVQSYLPKEEDEFWQDTSQVAKILTKLSLNPHSLYTELSGGMKRLVLLACILVQDPDVLILDEPTNHLDIQMISLLENLLLSFHKTIIFVTHDRELLQKVATHIVEIDNGQLLSWRGRYQAYLSHKETLLEAEEKANALFDKKLALEEKWIRQGIKARRTRNEGRVRQLKKMRDEHKNRRTRPGQVSFSNVTTATSGKIVFEAKQVSFEYDHKKIISDFSTLILRGDKVGIVGPNGVGKSTLINLLLGKLQPTRGTIKQGTQLTIGYFDQHRMQLDENKTVQEAVSEVGDTITVNNTEKHIMGYLQDFLFSLQKARTPIKNLSGGERNRVMLAKVLSKPCNLLVMDEPTNDLDIETLELLEELLLNYEGTLLLISHDRAFLNNVVTQTLVFQGGGKIMEHIGGFEEWQGQAPTSTLSTSSAKQQTTLSKSSQKLTYKEQTQLKQLPEQIECLETREKEITLLLADPTLYKEQAHEVAALSQELKEITQQIATCYEIWEELDNKSKS